MVFTSPVHTVFALLIHNVAVLILKRLTIHSSLVYQRCLWVTLLLQQSLFLILGCNLCVMLQYASSLVAPLYVLAVDTFAILVACNACLEALTVLFQAFGFLAVAAFQVPLLTCFWSCVGGWWWLWLLLLRSRMSHLFCAILKFTLRMLAVYRVYRTVGLIMCWLFIFLTRILLSLILWLICVSRFVWLRCDFGSESLRIPF